MANSLSLEDALQAEQRKLETLEGVRETRIGQWERQLAGAGDWAKPRIQEQFEDWKESNAQDIEKLRLQIGNLKARIKERDAKNQERARAALANMKADALRSWKEQGGTEEGFNQAWPAMEQDLLIKRTMEAVAQAADPVQKKREQLGGL
jgi:hypothetical protein